jgi:hypothetical protein
MRPDRTATAVHAAGALTFALRASIACVIAFGAACAGGAATTEPPLARQPAVISVALGDGQRAVVANPLPLRPTVRLSDAAGAPVMGVKVSFVVAEGNGWTVTSESATDGAGNAGVDWYLGPVPGQPQRLTATAGAGLAITFGATADPLVPGTTYHGAEQYVEFTAGGLPLIVSAPHGGTLRPAGMPDRTGAGVTTVQDANTDELARDIRNAFSTALGGVPHTIVVNLHRIKLDANREIVEAALGNAAAERAWREYHGFIDAARTQVTAAHGRGFYVDLHGHAHAIPRLELGYLLSAADLRADDAVLNSNALVQASSIRTLVETTPATHAALLRGAHSLGTLFEERGYPAVPSAAQPSPGSDEPYFTGGYNSRRHGSRDGGAIDGVQIEANRPGVRDSAASRQAFAARFVEVMQAYFAAHYGIVLGTAGAR